MLEKVALSTTAAMRASARLMPIRVAPGILAPSVLTPSVLTASAPAPGVLIVDSNPMMRAGLRAALAAVPDLSIAGEAAGGYAALMACRQLDVRVAVLDFLLDDLDIYEAAALLRAQRQALPILVLYTSLSPFEVAQLLHAGVTGLIARNARVEDFVQAVRTLAGGGSYLPAAFTAKLFREAPVRSGVNFGGLTERELDVLRYVASGFSNKDIARRLGLSVRTVETHRLNLRRKTRMSRPKDLVQLAKRFGLIDGTAPAAERETQP